MPWIRIAACAAAALSVASYAAATPLEALLGQSLNQSRGTPAAAGPAPQLDLPAKAPVGRFRQALDAVQPEPAATTRGATDSRVYQRAAPAVVLILTDLGLGSGSVISADGQIITNAHVIRGAKTIGVVFKPVVEGAAPAKSDLRRARVVKVDQIADLALIQVDDVPARVTPLTLGDSTQLQVGADVHAIGHPTGETWTYTRGVVSQVRRAYDWKVDDKVEHEATVIQTQTPINPGNSGGPLLDDQARIVGVNSFTGEGEGMNYAVSAEDVKSLLARPHDRLAATVTAAADAPCKWKELKSETWTDPPGLAVDMDTDCDGEGDALVFTPKKKRDPIVIMRSERSEKGEIDTFYFDANRDGEFDWVEYDTDGDGKIDMRAEYRKGEDEPYRWEKVSAH